MAEFNLGCLPLTVSTPNTTRFQGSDQYQTGVAISEAVWNNPADPMLHPGAVVLVRGDGQNYQEALVSSPLMHFPRNAPILLTEPYTLNLLAQQELIRLNPTGKGAPAQVLTIGSLSPVIDDMVRSLGYSVCRINGGDPVATAVQILSLLGEIRNVMLVSGEYFEEALPAAGWAVHQGDPILLTGTEYLPPITAQAIRQTQPNVYIIGSERTISRRVEATVSSLTDGYVARISGRDPFELAVNFTRYQSPKGGFGWNVNGKLGWSFRFARYDQWYEAINGDPLSHMGKHSPLLLVHPRMVPQVTAEYIISVNPRHPEPKPPFMHGFVVGNDNDISCPVQWQLDSLLQTVMEMKGHQ